MDGKSSRVSVKPFKPPRGGRRYAVKSHTPLPMAAQARLSSLSTGIMCCEMTGVGVGGLDVMWKKLAGSETRPSDYYSIRFHLTIRACICIPFCHCDYRLVAGG